MATDLMTETGMSRPWVYLRLHELTEQGQVTQVSRGRWRAKEPSAFLANLEADDAA